MRDGVPRLNDFSFNSKMRHAVLLIDVLVLFGLRASTSAFSVVVAQHRVISLASFSRLNFVPGWKITPLYYLGVKSRRYRSGSVTMRDGSMVRDFEVGDLVRVQPGTFLDGMDWGGLEGVVTTTWVK